MILIEKYSEEFKKAILIRRCEEKLLDLYNEGKLNGTVHTCIGQEFSGVAVSKYLQPQDFVVSNHRGHGHYISRTSDLIGLFGELMGKTIGCSGGIGGSQHFYNENYLSNGIQGGMTPIASGVALAGKMKSNNSISVAFIGDGTLGEGIFYETLNIAGIWKLPVLFVLENNGIAQSTDSRQTISGSIKGRAEAFNAKYFHTCTDDTDALMQTVEVAVNYARINQLPVLLEIKTNRLKSHSKGDDNRESSVVDSLWERDPIRRLQLDNPEIFNQLVAIADIQIQKALNAVEKSDILKQFSTELDTRLEKDISWRKYSPENNFRGNEAIYEFFKQEMKMDKSIFLMGEDIETANDFNPGPYGGAFKVTKDLSVIFKGRVKNTPISESAITGLATGLALGGFKPFLEIMFGDFMTLTFDQLLQHSTKFRLMFNKQLKVPLVVRSPMGGYRGYGPTHSQSLEKHFLGIPDLDVVTLNHRIDPRIIYRSVLANQDHPTFVVENKIAYTRKLEEDLPLGINAYISNENYPSYKLKFAVEDTADCTIVCYGGGLLPVESAIQKAFFEDEIICEVICLTMINPINIKPIAESVNNTSRLLIVEEGAGAAGFGSEVIALLAEKEISVLKTKRVFNNSIIPCSFEAENNILPNKEKIYQAINKILNEDS
jgi:2-oxoisovalerate dehydrogenase E1 component